LNARLPDSHTEPASEWFFGTLFGLLSALGYTAANVFLRSLVQCDVIWVSAMKASPLVVLAGPWLVIQLARGRETLPPPRVVVTLALAALVGQLGGNVMFQWSLGVVGMALSVPLCLGTLILSGAVLGRIFLGEPLTVRIVISVAILVIAIAVLSFGASEAQQAVAETIPSAEPASFWHLAAGVSAASMSGVAYSILGVVIRFGVKGRASLSLTLLTVGAVGVLSLGSLSVWRIGWEGMWTTPWSELTLMLMAGLFNAAAFLALTKALKIASVVYVNALNATQAAMAAVAGILFFQEALSGQLTFGIVLTVIGLVLMKRGT
jgi:drug/metabolite transporter (DMT)-like permease